MDTPKLQPITKRRSPIIPNGDKNNALASKPSGSCSEKCAGEAAANDSRDVIERGGNQCSHGKISMNENTKSGNNNQQAKASTGTDNVVPDGTLNSSGNIPHVGFMQSPKSKSNSYRGKHYNPNYRNYHERNVQLQDNYQKKRYHSNVNNSPRQNKYNNKKYHWEKKRNFLHHDRHKERTHKNVRTERADEDYEIKLETSERNQEAKWNKNKFTGNRRKDSKNNSSRAKINNFESHENRRKDFENRSDRDQNKTKTIETNEKYNSTQIVKEDAANINSSNEENRCIQREGVRSLNSLEFRSQFQSDALTENAASSNCTNVENTDSSSAKSDLTKTAEAQVNGPKISLIPLAKLLREELLTITADELKEQTVCSSQPTQSKFRFRPNLVERRRKVSTCSNSSDPLVEKVANMNKSEIKNVINSSGTKYDEALKQQARKRLREEIRRQLKSMNIDKPKDTADVDFVTDNIVDAIHIPDVVLDEIRKAFGIEIFEGVKPNTEEQEQLSFNAKSSFDKDDPLSKTTSTSEQNLELQSNDKYQKEIEQLSYDETSNDLGSRRKIGEDFITHGQSPTKNKILETETELNDRAYSPTQPVSTVIICETNQRRSNSMEHRSTTPLRAPSILDTENRWSKNLETKNASPQRAYETPEPANKDIENHKTKGMDSRNKSSPRDYQIPDSETENCKSNSLERTSAKSIFSIQTAKTNKKARKRHKKKTASISTDIIVIDSSTSSSVTSSSSSDTSSSSSSDSDSDASRSTSSSVRHRRQKQKVDAENVVDSFEKLILSSLSEKLAERYSSKYSNSTYTKLHFISCICTSEYNSEKFTKPEIVKIQRNLKSEDRSFALEFLMREIVNVFNKQKKVSKRNEDANGKKSTQQSIVSTENNVDTTQNIKSKIANAAEKVSPSTKDINNLTSMQSTPHQSANESQSHTATEESAKVEGVERNAEQAKCSLETSSNIKQNKPNSISINELMATEKTTEKNATAEQVSKSLFASLLHNPLNESLLAGTCTIGSLSSNSFTELSSISTACQMPAIPTIDLEALKQQSIIGEAVVHNLREIDLKLLELHKRKMFIEEMILKLHKTKMETDMLTMKLQNEKFILLNTAMTANASSISANNAAIKAEKNNATVKKETESSETSSKPRRTSLRTAKTVAKTAPVDSSKQRKRKAAAAKNSKTKKPRKDSESQNTETLERVATETTTEIVDPVESEPKTTETNSSWDYSGMRAGSFDGLKSAVNHVRLHEDAVIATTEDGTLYKYNVKTLQLEKQFQKHSEAITQLYLCREKKQLYTTSLDGYLKKTALENFELDIQSLYLQEPLQSIEVQWGTAFIGSRWGNVFTYDMKSNTLSESMLCSTGASIIAIKAVKEGPRKVLIISSKGNNVHFRDATTGLLLRTLDVPKHLHIYSLLLDYDSIYCGTQKKEIYKYDFMTGTPLAILQCGNGAIAIKMYKNKFLFVGCYDGYIYVLDKEREQQIGRFAGSGKMVLTLEIVGDKIITSAKDKTMKIIDVPANVLDKMKF